jgi:hypothetical protein
MVITFQRRQGMSIDEFKTYRRDVHAPILFAIPESKLIRRFVVSYPVAAPKWPEPSYDALVEAWFDAIDDMNTLFFPITFPRRSILTILTLSNSLPFRG